MGLSLLRNSRSYWRRRNRHKRFQWKPGGGEGVTATCRAASAVSGEHGGAPVPDSAHEGGA